LRFKAQELRKSLKTAQLSITRTNCAKISGIFAPMIFFRHKKKPLAHLAHPVFGLEVLVLANNSVPRPLAQLGTNGVFTSFLAHLPWHSMLLGARGFFYFQK